MKIKNHVLKNVDYIQTPNGGGVINPKFIVMHYTAGWTGDSAINVLKKRSSKVSAHIVLDRDGTITQMMPFNKKTWHAGPSKYDGIKNLNSHSIGIEIVNIGYFKKDSSGSFIDPYGRKVRGSKLAEWGDTIPAKNKRIGGGTYYWPKYSEEQLDALDELVEALLDAYPNIRAIVSHEEIDTRGWKTDPGPAFPMKRYTQLLHGDRADLDEITPEEEKVNGKWPGNPYTVLASSLNVRGGPGGNFEVLCKVKRGGTVGVIGWDGDWAEVRIPGDIEGFVHGKYIDAK